VDAHESSLGSGGEDRQEVHEEDPAGIRPREEQAPGEEIMSSLPRSRPQRDAPRRKPARTRATGKSKPSASRRRTPASTASRARSSGAPDAASGPRPRASAQKAAVPPRPQHGESDVATARQAERAPGLPRLALDGAIEAAKLPIRVGANITFRALDAVTKGLRGR